MESPTNLGALNYTLSPPIIPPMTLRVYADGLEFQSMGKTAVLRFDEITHLTRYNAAEEMGTPNVRGGLLGALAMGGSDSSVFSFAGPGGRIVLEGRFASGHPKEIRECVTRALPLAVAKAKAAIAGGGSFAFENGSLSATTLSVQVPGFIGKKTKSIVLDDLDFVAHGGVVKKDAKKNLLGLPKTEFDCVAAKFDLVLQALLQEQGKLRLANRVKDK